MQKWEYIFVIVNHDNNFLMYGGGSLAPGPAVTALCDLGAEGWELVSAVPCDNQGSACYLYFKRPLQ
jgi:hypothetical protein